MRVGGIRKAHHEHLRQQIYPLLELEALAGRPEPSRPLRAKRLQFHETQAGDGGLISPRSLLPPSTSACQEVRQLPWKDLRLTASVVAVNQKGVISLSKASERRQGRACHRNCAQPSGPARGTRGSFRRDIACVSNFSGNPGMDGTNGLDGMGGTSGTPGSMDPNDPSPGGDGSNGSNGSADHDGDPGGSAPPVQVLVALQSRTHPLLQVRSSTWQTQIVSCGSPGWLAVGAGRWWPRRFRRKGRSRRARRLERPRRAGLTASQEKAAPSR